jgi:hypothetical protein
MLFAAWSPEAVMLFTLCVLGIIGYCIFYVWLAVNRPDAYRQQVQLWHDEDMADKQAKADAAARKHARNQQGMGILARLFRGWFR